MNSQNGFTIIELLITVVVIGILAGVMIGVINIPRQRQLAQDSVYASDIEKLMQGVESHMSGEGAYPVTTADPTLATYIKTWPANYTYYVSGNSYCISRPSAVNSSVFIKYYEPASPDTSICRGLVMYNCSVACGAVGGTRGLDRTGCTNYQQTLCL